MLSVLSSSNNNYPLPLPSDRPLNHCHSAGCSQLGLLAGLLVVKALGQADGRRRLARELDAE